MAEDERIVHGDLSMSDDIQKNVTKAFGPEDNSMIAKLLRGEIELEKGERPPKERPTRWESVSISKLDGRIVRVLNGSTRYDYYADDPRYSEYIEKLREKFPDLAPGKSCSIYPRGRVEIETKDL
ncbi:MAG: hypothetical protein R3F51_26955 [Cyanobacteriota/Melainabacteria group bacterium]